MADIIDRAYLEINGIVVPCEDISIDPEDDTDFVTAMTKDNAPLGVKRGNERFLIKGTAAMLTEETVDFDDLWETKENVKVKVEFEGGKTHSYSNGVVSKPGIASKHGDKVQRNIEIKAWNRVIS